MRRLEERLADWLDVEDGPSEVSVVDAVCGATPGPVPRGTPVCVVVVGRRPVSDPQGPASSTPASPGAPAPAPAAAVDHKGRLIGLFDRRIGPRAHLQMVRWETWRDDRDHWHASVTILDQEDQDEVQASFRTARRGRAVRRPFMSDPGAGFVRKMAAEQSAAAAAADWAQLMLWNAHA